MRTMGAYFRYVSSMVLDMPQIQMNGRWKADRWEKVEGRPRLIQGRGRNRWPLMGHILVSCSERQHLGKERLDMFKAQSY